MPVFISTILGWFTTGGVIATFFAMIAKKLTFASIILPIQITLLVALYIAKFAFLTTLISLIVWLYNRIVIVIDLINNLDNNNDFSIVLKFLDSIGFIKALNESFASFSFILVSILILMISKIVINGLQNVADEYYKIGVLLQLGFK